MYDGKYTEIKGKENGSTLEVLYYILSAFLKRQEKRKIKWRKLKLYSLLQFLKKIIKSIEKYLWYMKVNNRHKSWHPVDEQIITVEIRNNGNNILIIEVFVNNEWYSYKAPMRS